MNSRRVLRLIVAAVLATLTINVIPAYSSSESKSISALAIDPQTPTTLYAATSDGRVLKSTDGGASWSVTGLASSAVIIALAADPQTPGTVYASGATGSGSDVFKTVDGGESWNVISTLRYVSAWKLVLVPSAPTTLYALASGGIYKSTDGGRAWNQVTFYRPWYFDLAFVNDLVLDPLDAHTLYVSLDYSISATEDGYFPDLEFGEVLKSVDGGLNWSCILCADSSNWVFPTPVSRLAVGAANAEQPRAVYAADSYSTRIFRTVDDGTAWTNVAITSDACCLAVQALAVDAHNPATLFAVLPYVGVFNSADGGTSWTSRDTGLPDTRQVDVASLLIDATDSTILYAGTAFGVFKTLDGATSWAPTGLVQHSSLVSVSIDPVSVAAGGLATGTVTLLAPAPADGITVTISSDSPAAVAVPPTVTVPPGAMSASFTISAGLLPNYVWVTIAVCHLDATKGARVFVNARVIPSSLGLYPNSVTAGTKTGGLLTLSAAAPDGGAVVELSSSDPAAASVPATITVPAWSPNTWFTISSASVAVSRTVTISATYNGIATSALLTVNPEVTLASMNVDRATVSAGTDSIGTVILNAPAPAGGVVIALASSDAALLRVPAAVTVAAGATNATFTASTSACASGTVTITAAYVGVSRSATVTLATLPDTVAVQAADYFRKGHVLRIDATSTSATATLSAFERSSGAFIGTLTPYSGSVRRGEFTWPVNPLNITVRSDRCGVAASAVTVK